MTIQCNKVVLIATLPSSIETTVQACLKTKINPLPHYVHNCVQSKSAAFSECVWFIKAISLFQVNFSSFMSQMMFFYAM